METVRSVLASGGGLPETPLVVASVDGLVFAIGVDDVTPSTYIDG